MLFAHMSDCHIGSWRDPKLKLIPTQAFENAASICMEKNVDFILISGDFFNTSFPSLDTLKDATATLKCLKDHAIPVYIIPGSHDYSPSGKTILDVLEKAGLLINVVKGRVEGNKLLFSFTLDRKTGTKITGLLGKRGALEKSYYEALETDSLEREPGFKIFMLHSAIDELKPKSMEKVESAPLSLLPKNFNYYAAGHVHEVIERDLPDYGKICYPGPLFPNSFAELEKLKHGGFYLVEAKENVQATWQPLPVYNTFSLTINCDNKTAKQAEEEVYAGLKNKEFNDTIITIRLKGTLESGKISEINFREIFQFCYQKSAYYVMKSTTMLATKDFEEVKVAPGSAQEIEERLIDELEETPLLPKSSQKEFIRMLMETLNTEKVEGETNPDFEERVREDAEKVLKRVME